MRVKISRGQFMVKLVIDMMGGDNGSKATVEAVNRFLEEIKDCEIIAVGDEKELESLKDKVRIVPSFSVVPMECSAMQAMRMKDSSINIAVNTAKAENADGIVSAGSTSAFLSLATLICKKIEGIDRPALISPFITKVEGKYAVLLDCGASNENTPEELVQFAMMGQAYYTAIYGKEDPNFYLASNGSEEGKGSPVGKEAYQLMKGMKGFKGNMEARYALNGEADVVVFDGYSGNIFLKATEGMAKMMSAMIKDAFKSSLGSKIGYLFARRGFNKMKNKMDYKKVGGAFLIGVNTIPVKAHGNATGESFYYSMMIAYNLAKKDIVNKIKENLKK